MNASHGYGLGVIAMAAMVASMGAGWGCTASTTSSSSGSSSGSSSSGSSSGSSSSGSSSGVTGCATDPSLQCDPGSAGVDCATASDNPEALDPTFICSAPSQQSDGTYGYCCAQLSNTTCAQDTSVQGCAYPSLGFSCGGTDTPEAADPALTCSTGVADPTTGLTLFCCQ